MVHCDESTTGEDFSDGILVENENHRRIDHDNILNGTNVGLMLLQTRLASFFDTYISHLSSNQFHAEEASELNPSAAQIFCLHSLTPYMQDASQTRVFLSLGKSPGNFE